MDEETHLTVDLEGLELLLILSSGNWEDLKKEVNYAEETTLRTPFEGSRREA